MIQLNQLFAYYQIGRFIFALTLALSFQMAGFSGSNPLVVIVPVVYAFIALLRLSAWGEQAGYFDFLLDAVFVSAVVYVSTGVHSYLTFMYLFPIFLASLSIPARYAFLFPLAVSLLYCAAALLREAQVTLEHFINIALHVFAFFLISVAGNAVRDRMKKQEHYIEQLEVEKARMQGFERMYRVSADLAHELRNPLAAISGAAQFLQEGKCDRELIEMINAETRRLTALVNDFLLYARPAEAPRSDVDLGQSVRTLLQHAKPDRHVETHIADKVIVHANSTFLEAAVNNVLMNALEASREKVRVTLEPAGNLLSLKPGAKQLAFLHIEDDGDGVPEDARDKIFEPFMTTKQKGTGLGLTIAYRIVTSCGGSILVGGSDLGGAKFTVIVPMKG